MYCLVQLINRLVAEHINVHGTTSSSCLQTKKPALKALNVRSLAVRITVSFLTNTMADPDETREMEKRGLLHFTSTSGLTLRFLDCEVLGYILQ